MIGEEVQAENKTTEKLVNELYEVVISREKGGRNYGVVLLPEGLVEFIPEIKVLISEINEILPKMKVPQGELPNEEELIAKLTESSSKLFQFLPQAIKN